MKDTNSHGEIEHAVNSAYGGLMISGKSFIFFFLLAVITLVPSQGECENWKEFFSEAMAPAPGKKDGVITYYYDKDSTHYPYQKKILGLMVRNKDIVNVWVRTRDISKNWIGDAYLLTIYCATRKFEDPGNEEFNNFYYELKGIKGERVYSDGYKMRFPILPGSRYEILLKKVCP